MYLYIYVLYPEVNCSVSFAGIDYYYNNNLSYDYLILYVYTAQLHVDDVSDDGREGFRQLNMYLPYYCRVGILFGVIPFQGGLPLQNLINPHHYNNTFIIRNIVKSHLNSMRTVYIIITRFTYAWIQAYTYHIIYSTTIQYTIRSKGTPAK